MPGIRNNCELIHAYLGGVAGLLVAFMLLMGVTAPAGSSDSVALALLTGGFSLLFVAGMFRILYRQRFWDLVLSLLLSSIILGFVMYYIMLLFGTTVAQPFVLFAIGVLLGAALGRIVCYLCHDGKRPSDGLTHT
jgi:cellulose synthase/poly-beta-1,6-N-acetylglucosamine synthase-like glycosyltransferase